MLKLTMVRYKVDGGSLVKNGGAADFVAMINPDGYSITQSIGYSPSSDTDAKTGGATEVKFASIPADEIKLKELIIDGTGVIPNSSNQTVQERIQSLRAVAYDYVGTEHETPVVELSWGNLHYFARLKSMDVAYTLFDPDGKPLRAKVTLQFLQYRTQAEIQKWMKKSSPDLTHLVEVKQGDTLPLLCHRIYKDSGYYLEVARINQLTNVRKLVPGTILRFPPLGP